MNILINPFRERHLTKAHKIYLTQHLPLDLFLSNYYRENKAIGSKDRAFISETLFGIIRWQGLLEASLDGKASVEKMIDLFLSKEIGNLQENEKLLPYERLSFPLWLFEKLVNEYGVDEAYKIASNSNEKAPRAVRVNLLKTSRDALFETLSKNHNISYSPHSKNGIIFNEKTNYIEIPEFKLGHFEIQDEGSQLLAELIDIKPGGHFLDFCSGSGGKTLAIAPKMLGKGQIYLHDIRPLALQEARKRLSKAGVQNAQFILAKDPKLNKLKHRMDAILVDAPCSGTGTLRRNPDMKWKLQEENIQNLILQQREIFKESLKYLKKDGVIVYGTCSLLKEENEEQAEYFIKTHQLEALKPFMKTLPVNGGPDGFFGAAFRFATRTN